MVDSDITIINKNGIKIIKLNQGTYSNTLSFQNDNYSIDKLINLDLLKLLFDINEQYYEFVNLEKINENEAKIIIVIKNLFQDMGVTQKYLNLNVNITRQENIIIFNVTTIYEEPEYISQDIELIDIDTLVIICEIISSHTINIKSILNFDYVNETREYIPLFLEKILASIAVKILYNVKQFIDNIIL
jgi:hypothetical protein